jgi:hypothetical protein
LLTFAGIALLTFVGIALLTFAGIALLSCDDCQRTCTPLSPRHPPPPPLTPSPLSTRQGLSEELNGREAEVEAFRQATLEQIEGLRREGDLLRTQLDEGGSQLQVAYPPLPLLQPHRLRTLASCKHTDSAPSRPANTPIQHRQAARTTLDVSEPLLTSTRAVRWRTRAS